MIRDSLQRILNIAMESNKNVQQNNAQNAVLFEAINLIIHLDTEHALMRQISSRLGRFITSRETNVRYLGLEAMTHLAARAENLDPIKQHQDVILGSLKDRDISVRRKGLDLLYSMCDSTNSGPIVSELLHYLQNADFAIREETYLPMSMYTLTPRHGKYVPPVLVFLGYPAVKNVMKTTSSPRSLTTTRELAPSDPLIPPSTATGA